MNNYLELDALKETLSLGNESFADDDIELAIAAASRGVDKAARRRFYADEDADQVRYYSPTRPGLLIIDDLVTLTSLSIDPNGAQVFDQPWTQNLHFMLEPLNAPADGWPWTALRTPRNGAYSFPCYYERSVKITGKFGWPAVPDPIKDAATLVATRLLKRAREAPFGVVSMGMDAAARIARTDPDICFLIDPYARGTGAAGLA